MRIYPISLYDSERVMFVSDNGNEYHIIPDKAPAIPFHDLPMKEKFEHLKRMSPEIIMDFTKYCEDRGHQHYNWGSPSACAFAQYIRHLGFHDVSYGTYNASVSYYEKRFFGLIIKEIEHRLIWLATDIGIPAMDKFVHVLAISNTYAQAAVRLRKHFPLGTFAT